MDSQYYFPGEYHSVGCPLRLCQFSGTCDKCPFRLLFQVSNWMYDRFAQPYEIASYIYDRMILDYPTLTSIVGPSYSVFDKVDSYLFPNDALRD